MTPEVREILAKARARGPWRVTPHGGIRNQRGQCPLSCVTAEWLSERWEINEYICNPADLPKHKHRVALMEALGMGKVG